LEHDVPGPSLRFYCLSVFQRKSCLSSFSRCDWALLFSIRIPIGCSRHRDSQRIHREGVACVGPQDLRQAHEAQRAHGQRQGDLSLHESISVTLKVHSVIFFKPSFQEITSYSAKIGHFSPTCFPLYAFLLKNFFIRFAYRRTKWSNKNNFKNLEIGWHDSAKFLMCWKT